MPKQREKAIVTACLIYLNSRNRCRAVKRHGTAYGTTGEPDIDAVYRSFALKLEVKKKGQDPTLLQQHRIRQWRDAGCVAVVVTSADDCACLLSLLDIALGSQRGFVNLGEQIAEAYERRVLAAASLTPADALRRAGPLLAKRTKL